MMFPPWKRYRENEITKYTFSFFESTDDNNQYKFVSLHQILEMLSKLNAFIETTSQH